MKRWIFNSAFLFGLKYIMNTELYGPTWEITGFTLIDITATGVTVTNSIERNQQRNLETLIQVLGLRTQIIEFINPIVTIELMREHAFGSSYLGEHNVWKFSFFIGFADLYFKDGRTFGCLEDDLYCVPIISGLTETIIIDKSVFTPTGDYQNIYFR